MKAANKKNHPAKKNHPGFLAVSNRYATPLTWIFRIAVGIVFIFSGFVKSIDPWGTLYKIRDYIGVLDFDISNNILLTATFALCGVEFLLGIFIITGCYRRATPIMLAAFMAVMLPLTLWIATADPVPDCGCFGDAIIISNWATFWKNVLISAMVVWLLIYNRRCRSIVEPYLQWLAFTATSLYIVAIALIGYIYQPLIDFRPYTIGSEIIDKDSASGSDMPTGDENMIFIYEKEGVRKEFRADDVLPDEEDGWEFVERLEKSSGPSASANAEGEDHSERNFRIWDENGEEDITEMAAPAEGKRIFLLMPDLNNVSIATSWKINSLYTWADRNNIDMIAVVNGNKESIERWRDLSMPSYPIYTAEDTQIKEIVRGNPAVVYTEDGKIVWKSTLRALYTDDFLSADTSSDPRSFARDNRGILMQLSEIYAAIMALLIFLSFSPALTRRIMRLFKKS